MKTVSSLIYAIENYEKTLIQFGAKAKVNLMEGAKPSKNCDFRIDMSKVKRALAEVNEDNDTVRHGFVRAQTEQKMRLVFRFSNLQLCWKRNRHRKLL